MRVGGIGLLLGFSCVLALSLASNDHPTYKRLLADVGMNDRLLSTLENKGFENNNLLEIREVELGIDEKNRAWIYYKDEAGNEFGYHNLEEVELHLHKLEHHGDAYRLVDSNHMISLLVHDFENKEFSLTVWTFDKNNTKEKVALPSFHVAPRQLLRSKDLGDHGRKLKSSSSNILAAYDYTSAFSQGGCAAVVSDISLDTNGKVQESFIKLDTYSSQHRHRGLRATPFTDCYADQEIARVLDIGILADRGYFNSFDDNLLATQRSVEVIISNVNLIYFFQFNIHVRLQQLMVVTRNIGQAEELCTSVNKRVISRKEDLFDISPVNDICCIDIEETVTRSSLLQSFSKLAANGKPEAREAFIEVRNNQQVNSGGGAHKAAHWHFLSDCFPANCPENACTVGSALLTSTGSARGLACDFSGGRNIGISSRTFQTWLVVAHEMAHNFGGADHSFEEGRGRTGGLMDYGDGKVDGVYEFNSLRKTEFCNSIQRYIAGNVCERFGTQYFDILPDNCARKANFTREVSCEGICLGEKCVPLQLLIKVNTGVNETNPNLFDATILTEPAEFSPIGIESESEIVTAELALADPISACSPVTNLTDKIAIVRRGGCTFKNKVENVLVAGAQAIIIVNNDEGAPKAIGGENFVDLSVVGISRNDGNFLILSLEENPGLVASIGGFAASDQKLDFVPLGFFEEYFLPIMAFGGVMSITVLYFMLRGRDIIVDRMRSARENVVDAMIENKYRLMNAYESVRFASVRFAGGRAAEFADNEEIQRLNDQMDENIREIRSQADHAGDNV